MKKLNKALIIAAIISFLPLAAQGESLRVLGKYLGKNDAAIITNHRGKVLFSKNADKMLIPASTLKVLTSLAAYHILGEDFRFTTEFYKDENNNLKVKGYGDPLLISEALAKMAREASGKIDSYNDLILDSTYFDPIKIPGVTTTNNPFDAPNGALCVNFNTVSFKTRGGKIVSAEAQTPLLPIAMKKIKKSGLKKGRIIFSQVKDEHILYGGHMIKYFLGKENVTSTGSVKTGKVIPGSDRLIYRYVSAYSMDDIVSKLMAYSNNFIANQIFVAAGAKVYGSPGTLDKGLKAVQSFMNDNLETRDVRISEGSGISRKNRISPRALDEILAKFESHRFLMRHKQKFFYKTGTLRGIRTRAGFIETGDGPPNRFVVFLNTPRKSTGPIMSRISGFFNR